MWKLTEDTVLQRTHQSSLTGVRNLNMWGSDLRDVSILVQMPKVEVLSLSVNQISTLRPFAYCASLRELYLRKNAISDLSEVQYLSGLRNLRVLWLGENPCANDANYRLRVLSCVPQLTKLDDMDVSDAEREQALRTFGKAAPTALERPTLPTEAVKRTTSAHSIHSLVHSNSRHSQMSHHSGVDYPPQPRPVQPVQVPPPTQQPQQAFVQAMLPAQPAQDEIKLKKREEAHSKLPHNSQHNLMIATMALLEEMDEQHLKWIRNEIDRRLQSGR